MNSISRYASTADDIETRISLIRLAIDFMRDPFGAIANRINDDSPESWKETLEELNTRYLAGLIKKAAIAVPGKKTSVSDFTEEQRKAVLQAAAEDTENRIQYFLSSNYWQAINYILPLKGKYADDNTSSVYLSAVLYFFAANTDILATQQESLTAENLEQIKDIFYRLDSFFYDNRETGENETQLFLSFVRQDQQEHKKKKQTIATENGAITTINNHFRIVTHPEYQNAFRTTTTGSVGFYKIDDHGNKQLVLDSDTELMIAMFTCAWIDYYSHVDSDTGEAEQIREIQVYMPKILREIGIDATREENQDSRDSRQDARHKAVNRMIVRLSGIMGELGDAKQLAMLSIHSYDRNTEILTFTSPYLHSLVGKLADKSIAAKESGKKFFYTYSDLIRAGIGKIVKNDDAREMIYFIVQGLQKNGTSPDESRSRGRRTPVKDNTVTYSVSCKTILKECPRIRERLKEAKDSRRKTVIINRAFTAMYRGLREATDIYQFYSDLQIDEMNIPTWTEVNTKMITIKHRGKNPDYEPPHFNLLAQETQE